MIRIPLSSSALAVIGLVVLSAPVSLGAQRARERGGAAVEGQAVPRSEPRRGTQDQAPPPVQTQAQRVAEPARKEVTPVPPARRSDSPNAIGTAVPRQVPRVSPQVVVPQAALDG